MLNNKGFDLWADNYDKSVEISDNEGSYPFAGYDNIIHEIYKDILNNFYDNILDIGFGTGNLISKLYESGCKIYGQDFSKKMIVISKEKMPDAKLYYGDFSKGLVEPLLENKYNAIIATYSLHHLTDKNKIILLENLQKQLAKGGCIYIGDIMFLTRNEHNKCMIKTKDDWDKDEIYIVINELKSYFPEMKFKKVSECSGIITIKNK